LAQEIHWSIQLSGSNDRRAFIKTLLRALVYLDPFHIS